MDLLAKSAPEHWNRRATPSRPMMRRSVIYALVCIAGLGWLAPWGLYELGLTNIEGRPAAPVAPKVGPEDDALLQRVFKTHSSISVTPISPWGYIVSLAMDTSTESTRESGAAAAWLIARDYNASHLKNRWSICWHLPGAALTIWLTRNWTSDQVVKRAAELARQRSE
jgi:hypothetical protein